MHWPQLLIFHLHALFLFLAQTHLHTIRGSEFLHFLDKFLYNFAFYYEKMWSLTTANIPYGIPESPLLFLRSKVRIKWPFSLFCMFLLHSFTIFLSGVSCSKKMWSFSKETSHNQVAVILVIYTHMYTCMHIHTCKCSNKSKSSC